MGTYLWQVVEARSPQVLQSMPLTRIQVHLLDDRSDHLDGVIFMSNKPLDGVRINGTFPRH